MSARFLAHIFYVGKQPIKRIFNLKKIKTMGNKTNGLLALLGLGAVAYYKYKNSSPEQQQAVKDKINAAKDNFGKLSSNVKEKANDLASQAQDKVNQVANRAEDKAQEFKADAERAM